MDSFAKRLNELIGTRRRGDGKEFSNIEIEQKTGGKLDASYIGRLRNGRVDNPTLNTINVLADAFEIEPDYFLRRGTTLSGPDIEQVRIALRSAGLNSEAQEFVENLIQALQKGTHKE